MTSDGAGGVGIHARTLAAALRARGHQVTLAPVAVARPFSRGRSRWSLAGGLRLPAGETSAACGLRKMPPAAAPGRLPLPGPIEWDSTQPVEHLEGAVIEGRQRLAACHRQRRVDLLHCNQFAWVRSLPGVPSLLAVHSDVVSWWRAVHGAPPPPTSFSRWYIALVQRGLREAEAVVTPSAATRADLDASFGWTGAAEVVFNGWEAEAAAAMAPRRGAISAGRLWDDGKQFRLLMRPDLPCLTVLAGDAGGRRPPAFANLRYAGPLGHAELLRLFARSRIYIGCSRYEPFGLAPLEAATQGCCLLLNDIASFREVWGPAAHYFARDNGDDLVAWLRRLAREPELVASGAQAAACRARQLNAAAMAAAYEALYQRLTAA